MGSFGSFIYAGIFFFLLFLAAIGVGIWALIKYTRRK